MSRSNRGIKFLGLASGFTMMVVGGILAVPFVAKDAFAGYRKSGGPLGGNNGIVMEDVRMQSYDKGQLVVDADIDKVTVRKDRQFFDFSGVKRGTVYGKEGTIHFASEQATWDDIVRQLRFDAGVHLTNKDFNLFAPKLTLDDEADVIQAPGPVTGTLKGGKIAAMNFKYKMANEEFMAGPVRWKGQLPGEVAQDAPVAQSKTPWDIEARSTKGTNAGLLHLDARATDGEIIVKAPRIEQDRKTDVLTCTGKVYYFSTKANLVADSAIVYRKEKRVVLKGNVRLLIKPKNKPDLTEQEIPPFRPDVPESIAKQRPEAPTPEETQQQKDLDEALRSAKTVRDYPAMVRAEEVEYWYAKGSRRAVVTGKPEAFQELPGGRWRTVVAMRGLYDGEKETLRMESSAPNKREVNLKSSLGDDLFGYWFVVSTKEDDEEWEGDGVKGRVMADDDEIPKDKKTPPPTGGGTSGSVGASDPGLGL